MTFPVYIGYDRREPRTYAACVNSLLASASGDVAIQKLDSERLADTGILRRPQDTRGQRYDILSNDPAPVRLGAVRRRGCDFP
jgi:hypothetical protein